MQAYSYAGKGSFSEASQCQSWVVKRTDEGRYDLACWESLAGRTEVALYWLQEAGKHEGVNTRWAQQDPDLENVRSDPRWPNLLKFLQRCEKYWRAAGPKETVLITPSGYDGQAELPVVIWLHGMGQSPAAMKSVFQTLADRYRIGFICVSGTIPTGKTKFAWADVAEDDYQRIKLALIETDQRMHRRQGAVALGFSQGAMVAIEVSVRHPETFAGAISISAGTGSPVQLDAVTAKAALSHQGFVIVCGAKENEYSVQRSNELADWLRAGGANVLKPDYPGHSTHSIPPDFGKRLPEWLEFIERASGKQIR
jgi:predicted esterase